MFAVGSLASSISLALEHVSFKDLTIEDYIVISCLIASNFTNTMMAWMQQHLRKYLSDIFVDNDDSTTTTSAQVSVQQTTTTKDQNEIIPSAIKPPTTATNSGIK